MNTQFSLQKLKKIEIPSLPDTVVHSARRAWLASLGTASIVGESTGRLVDQLGERGRSLEKQSRKSIDSLVDRGEKFEKNLEKKFQKQSKKLGKETRKLEDEAKKSVDKAIGQAEETVKTLRDGVDNRLSRMTERLGLPNREQIRQLSERVEELTRKVEAFQGGPLVEATPVVFQLVPLDKGWALKGGANDTIISEHPTKDKALVAGRKLALSQQPSELVVYKLDGEVQSTYSYEG